MVFVSPPDKGWDGRHEIEDLRRSGGVIGQPHGTRDSESDVRDDAVSPSADLVPEQPEAPSKFRSDRTFHHDPASLPETIGDGGLFDHEAAIRSGDHERRVIQVARTSSLHTCGDRLEQPSAESHDVLPRAQRDPVEIHGSGRLARPVSGFALLGPHADSEP